MVQVQRIFQQDPLEMVLIPKKHLKSIATIRHDALDSSKVYQQDSLQQKHTDKGTAYTYLIHAAAQMALAWQVFQIIVLKIFVTLFS